MAVERSYFDQGCRKQVAVAYLHLPPGGALPLKRALPFKAVVVIEGEVTEEWRIQVSDWLVHSGCRYMMARGQDCSRWDDSVDWAALAKHDFGEVPDDAKVMTTWHDEESLGEVFCFAGDCATHPMVELDEVVIIHISERPRAKDMLSTYLAAQASG